MNAYATYATGYKSVGINMGGLPTDAWGSPYFLPPLSNPKTYTIMKSG